MPCLLVWGASSIRPNGGRVWPLATGAPSTGPSPLSGPTLYLPRYPGSAPFPVQGPGCWVLVVIRGVN